MKSLKKYDVIFDIYENGVKTASNVSAAKYFGGEVLATDNNLAGLTVQEWLCEELEEQHNVKYTRKGVYVDGVLNFGGFKVQPIAA